MAATPSELKVAAVLGAGRRNAPRKAAIVVPPRAADGQIAILVAGGVGDYRAGDEIWCDTLEPRLCPRAQSRRARPPTCGPLPVRPPDQSRRREAANPPAGSWRTPAIVANPPGSQWHRSWSASYSTRSASEEATRWRLRMTGEAQCSKRLRMLIHEADPEVVEEVKWRKPSNPAGVPVWSDDGMICTGETYKDKVKLTFARGAALDDPSRLFNSSLDGGTRRAIDFHEGDDDRRGGASKR